MEKYVCNLEYSRQLEKLGVKQESIFYWTSYPVWMDRKDKYGEFGLEYFSHIGNRARKYSAFTVGELGEMLPWDKLPFQVFRTVCNGWGLSIHENDNPKGIQFYAYANTEVDTRAKMLIYLLENKLMEVPK